MPNNCGRFFYPFLQLFSSRGITALVLSICSSFPAERWSLAVRFRVYLMNWLNYISVSLFFFFHRVFEASTIKRREKIGILCLPLSFVERQRPFFFFLRLWASLWTVSIYLEEKGARLVLRYCKGLRCECFDVQAWRGFLYARHDSNTSTLPARVSATPKRCHQQIAGKRAATRKICGCCRGVYLHALPILVSSVDLFLILDSTL